MTGSEPECEALAEGLREMRARTGLSLVALAECTAYSKSSWERYLNGKKPVPRQAVEALCALAGEHPGRPLALWELADVRWSGRAGSARGGTGTGSGSTQAGTGDGAGATSPADPTAPAADEAVSGRADDRGTRRGLRWLFALGAGLVALVMALLSVRLGGRQADGMASPVLDPPPGCQGTGCDGKDPDLMNCGLPGRADSVGPEHRTATGAGMEIRYSRACAAGWGRVWHAKVGDAIEISAPGARPRRVVIISTADTGRYCFTPMIGGPARTDLRLCFFPAGGASRECVQA